MGKRRHFDHTNRNEKSHNVEPLYGKSSPWDPLNQPAFDRRDQSYVRKIKPQNANQSLLLDAMAQAQPGGGRRSRWHRQNLSRHHRCRRSA